MYVKIAKFKQLQKERGISTLITHIWLYKDDGERIKRLPHEEDIMNKVLEIKADITIPEVQEYLKEHEIEKLIPKEPNLFDWLIKWL